MPKKIRFYSFWRTICCVITITVCSLCYAVDNETDLSSMIPAKYASIQVQHPAPSDHTFFIINDFHYNYQAQRNIAHILDHLISDCNVDQIFTEGGSGNLNLSHLRSYAPKISRENVSLNYLKNGLISGEEFLDITSDLNFTITGLENQSLYTNNVNSLFDTIAVSNEFQPFLASLSDSIDILKKEIFSESLSQFDQQRYLYHNNKTSINDYLSYLRTICQRYEISVDDYLNINTLLASIDYYTNLNELSLRTSINDYITKIETTHPDLYDNWNDLHKKVVFSSPDTLIDILRDIQTASGYSFSQESDIQAFYDIHNDVNSLDMLAVADELNSLENCLYENLATSDEQPLIIQISENLIVFKKLLSLQLTRAEYLYYTENIDTFQISLWTEQLSDLADDHLIQCSIPETPPLTMDKLDAIDRFYRLAVNRDNFFIQQLYAYLQDAKPSISVIIVGGFHRDSLIDFFEASNVSYAVVSPHFTKTEATCDYIDIFQNKTAQHPLLSSNEQFLDVQATRGTRTELQLINTLRDKAKEENWTPPLIEAALKEGRGTAISNLLDVDLNVLFALPEERLAYELSKDIYGITDDMIGALALRLRGPPGNTLKTRLKAAYTVVQDTIRQFKNRERSNQYMILIESPQDKLAFTAQDSAYPTTRPFYSKAPYYGLSTIEYAMSSKETAKRFRRLLKYDTRNIMDSESMPSNNDMRLLTLFWKAIRAHIEKLPHREIIFQRSISNAESRFFVSERDGIVTAEDITDPDASESIRKSQLKTCISTQHLTKRTRENVAVLPFFVDGVGSSIRWIHAIRGIRRDNPDEYLSVVLFDIPYNHDFIAQQLEGIIDEIIWVNPISPLVKDPVNLLNQFRQKDSSRVLWELVIQELIERDKDISKSYLFEKFLTGYDFSTHHPDFNHAESNIYASAYFDMKELAAFPVSEADEKVADQFYEQLGIDPETDIVIPYSLRLDMNLTEAVRNTNIYDTVRFVKLLNSLTYQKTGKPAKIIFFGNSPKTFIEQLIAELARIEYIPTKYSYFERIKSLTFDLVTIGRELQDMIDSDPNLIDFTNSWQLHHNSFQQKFTIPQQAAILKRGAFATGTNSGALDIPLACGVPGVRLTEYHYLGYNEFLARDLTINLYTTQNTKSTKYSFANMVADRAGVETYLNFLTSPPLQNDYEAAREAYSTMLDYIRAKRSIGQELPHKHYYVQRRHTLKANVSTMTTSLRYDKPAPASVVGIIKSFGRWGVTGLDSFYEMDLKEARSQLKPRCIDFKFPTSAWTPDIDVSLFFGLHRFKELPFHKTYMVAIMPEQKLPSKQEMANNPYIFEYLASADKIFVWSTQQYTTLTEIFPELKSLIVMADEELPPYTPKQLTSIPQVQADTRAFQIIRTIEDLGGQVMEHLKNERSVRNLKVIKRALNPDDKSLSISHIEDFNWGHDLVERIYGYFYRNHDDQAVDDLNYVGIWLISSSGWNIDAPVPFLLRFNDHMEIEGENIKRGYGANLFLSSEAFYKAYLAVIKGAPVDSLASLIRFQAHVVRTMSTRGFSDDTHRLLLEEMIELENNLIASFMNAYDVQFQYVAPGINPQQLTPMLERMQIINKARTTFGTSL